MSDLEFKGTWQEAVKASFPEADEKTVEFILWEMTCHPFSTVGALTQIKALEKIVEPSKAGWLARLIAEHDRQETEMYEGMREFIGQGADAPAPSDMAEGHRKDPE